MEVQHEQVRLVLFPVVTRVGRIPLLVQRADNKKQRQRERQPVRLIAQHVAIVHQNRRRSSVAPRTRTVAPPAAKDRHHRQVKRELLTQTTQRLGHGSPNTEQWLNFCCFVSQQ